MPYRILTVVGARPQFVKAMLLSELFRKEQDIDEIMVHTGQHYDRLMSGVFFRDLGIPKAQYHMNVHGGGHGQMTGRMLQLLEPIVNSEHPDAVLVFGDTNSTLAGALVGAKLCIPVIHVESGLRSFRRCMPEEINRVLTDRISRLLLCPTRIAVSNLESEGIVHGVHHVGDIMHDVTLRMLPVARRYSQILGRLGLRPGAYDVVTFHRAENTDSAGALLRIADHVEYHASIRPVVLPLHPRTRKAMAEHGISLTAPGIMITEPLGFLDMCLLVHHARIIHTDSGGLQKEAYFHRVPCVTLREETEWMETIEHGWNRLWTVSSYNARSEIADYGDGQSASRMLDLIKHARRNGLL